MRTDANTTLTAEITSGKYRSEYLVYVRKSTDDADNQKNSIRYQKAETARFSAREHLVIAPLTLPGFCTDGIVSERHSAFSERVDMDFGDDGTVQYRVERPKFHRLVGLLSRRHFRGVIVLCWDRLSRNKADEVIIRKLMKAGVEVRFVLAQYDKGSAGELHMDIDGMFSEHHSRVTREKVSDTIRKKRDEGFCTHRANVGYLNQGTMEWKALDPERAPIIRRLFEFAETTEWSLSDLRRWAIEQGFTMPPARRRRTKEERLADEERDERTAIEKVCRPPSVTNIHYILTSPFYAGKVRGNGGVWVNSASHEALVSEARFARVQAKLARRRTSVRYPKKLDHPFRGLVRCECGRVYTPYLQKGILYYGARCDRRCPNARKSVNFAFVAGKVGRRIDTLWLADETIAALEARAGESTAERVAEHDSRLEDDERRRKKLNSDLAYLIEHKLTLLRAGAYTAEELAQEAARLTSALASLSANEVTAGVPVQETIEDAITLSELIKCGADIYDCSAPAMKDRIARTIVSELTVSQDIAQVQCRSAFKWLEACSFQQSALCDPLSELLSHRDDIRAAIEELETVLSSGAEVMPRSP